MYNFMLKNHFKIAYRNIFRHKAFSLINIVGLALGLTACLLIGLFVHDELQYDKFIPEGDRVYRVYNEQTRGEGNERTARTPPMYAPTLQQALPEVDQSLRIMEILSTNLFEIGNKKIYEDGGIVAEQTFFDLFPLPFKYGSFAKALDDPSSIIISEDLSEKFFGEDNPVGKEIILDKEVYQIKGVLRNRVLKFHLKINYILPFAAAQIPEERWQSWHWQQFNTYVKLKEGADVGVVETKFQDIVKAVAHPLTEGSMDKYLPMFQPLDEIYLYSASFKIDMAVTGNIVYVRALVIIAIFILLIACFNFVNLATAKSFQRAKEVGVRKSMGASRNHLALQFIGETVLLTSISVVFSAMLTSLFLPRLNEFTGKDMVFDVVANPFILLLLIALTLVVGITSGFYPAIILSGFKPVKVLKGAVTNDSGPGKIPWLRHGLIVVQFALSIFLMISSVIVLKQVHYLHNKELGFNKEEIMFFPMRGDNMFENYRSFKNELLQKAGVSSVSIGYGFPGDIFAGDDIIVPRDGQKEKHSVTQLLVDFDYIKTLDIPLVAGRAFSEEFNTDEHHAFIINETAVRELGFGTPEKALGQKLEWNVWEAENPDSLKRGKIIGVVKDFHYKSLFDKMEPTVLQIFPPAYWKVAVKLETRDIAQTIDQVQEVWNKFTPGYLIEYKFLDDNFEQMYKAEEKLKTLLLAFTTVAIFVGCLGLFGLVAYVAESRKKEIGIRKILGAATAGIVALISQEFLKLVVVAALFAFPFSWLVMQNWLEDFAYRIDIPIWVFFAAVGAAAIVAFLTISYIAIKAAMENPTKNLRTE